MYEIWRQRNPECRIYGCQETNEPEKLYYEKYEKITEMEVEDIRRELQERQRSHLEEGEEKQLEHSGTIRDGEQKPNASSTTEEETEIHQQRNQIHKLKEKLKVRIIRCHK